jgi:predicted anti-sigma-YlaC factor YlaD
MLSAPKMRRYAVPATLALTLAVGGCSIKKLAIKQVGASLASGPSVFETDEDIELVGDALPFSLKFVESLLAEVPDDRNLRMTAVKGFVLYSYAYVDLEAEQVIDQDLDEGKRLRERAHKLYLRGAQHGFHALEKLYPGFEAKLGQNPVEAVAATNPKRAERDVPLLYWTAAALGLAISAGSSDTAMLARLPEVEALARRALELDEDWDYGALHEFQVVFEAANPGQTDRDAIERHYRRGLELSHGLSAGLYVAYAESVAVPEQDAALFRAMLGKALEVDVDAAPEDRLANLVAQKRARWLLAHTEDLILTLQ